MRSQGTGRDSRAPCPKSEGTWESLPPDSQASSLCQEGDREPSVLLPCPVYLMAASAGCLGPSFIRVAVTKAETECWDQLYL